MESKATLDEMLDELAKIAGGSRSKKEETHNRVISGSIRRLKAALDRLSLRHKVVEKSANAVNSSADGEYLRSSVRMLRGNVVDMDKEFRDFYQSFASDPFFAPYMKELEQQTPGAETTSQPAPKKSESLIDTAMTGTTARARLKIVPADGVLCRGEHRVLRDKKLKMISEETACNWAIMALSEINLPEDRRSFSVACGETHYKVNIVDDHVSIFGQALHLHVSERPLKLVVNEFRNILNSELEAITPLTRTTRRM